MGHALDSHVSRRQVLRLGAALPAVTLAACASPIPSPSPSRLGSPTASVGASPAETPIASASPQPSQPPARGSVLYRDGALADGRSERLQLNVSILVVDGTIAWIRPTGGEEDPGDAEIVDAAGSAFVPGMVDCHSHVTGPGGANWIQRFADPPARIAAVAEANAELALDAGVRWLRDVGSPVGVDPVDGRERALALGVRDRWAGRRDRPYLRAAGTWLMRSGTIQGLATAEASNGDELLAIAMRQLDDGADFLKLYLDGPDPSTSPWTANEVARVVTAAHERGAKVTAHAGRLNGAREAVLGGVDSIEHGFELDAAVAAEMAARGTFLVSTLTVMRSWLSFGATTSMPRFAAADGRAQIAGRYEAAQAALRTARDGGVAICTGTDFGGGSARANQLAWEVESQVAAGLAPQLALAAATWRGGELLGEPDAGVIREGGPADFFLVHGDPLSEPAALWRVWRRAWDPPAS
jgi:imidazolonepropionase-like amidohydrolase